jgi:hypothetical protein
MRNPKIVVVYAGARRAEKGLVHCYFEVLDSTTLADTDERQFAGRLSKEKTPGEMVSIEYDSKSGSWFPETAQVVGMFRDRGMVTAWQIAHDAEVDSEKASTGKIDLPFDTLEPFRIAYRSLDPESRAVMMAQVVRHIVRGIG